VGFRGDYLYYDDLTLLRCGLIDTPRYLGLLAQTISGVQRGAGRLKQTLEESSFDAWTKYYRQDENSPNSIVSYYTKGSLAALALDLTLRDRSAGKTSG
jgi:predicted metalloprotease with PDZ domain